MQHYIVLFNRYITYSLLVLRYIRINIIIILYTHIKYVYVSINLIFLFFILKKVLVDTLQAIELCNKTILLC
jgi:hypothetical protein